MEPRGSGGSLPGLQSLDLAAQHQPVEAFQILGSDQATHLGEQGELGGQRREEKEGRGRKEMAGKGIVK